MQYYLIEDWMTIKIGRNAANRITVSFPYNPYNIVKIKTIERYRWHAEGKYWSIPYPKLEKLFSLFDGRNIIVDHSVWLDELKKEL